MKLAQTASKQLTGAGNRLAAATTAFLFSASASSVGMPGTVRSRTRLSGSFCAMTLRVKASAASSKSPSTI